MVASQPNDWHELDRLIDGACDRTLKADEWIELSERLVKDREARVRYAAATELHAMLAWQIMPNARLSPTELQRYTEVERDVFHIDTSDNRIPDTALPSPSSLGFLAPLHHIPAYFSSGWPQAYLVSTVVCAIGISILALIPVHHHVQVARQADRTPTAPASRPSSLAPRPSEFLPLIGQITGMVNCKWSDPQTEASNGANVPVGRKYALASGLMEITYDTGAKVILQGPCTYEVESPAGGYLSVGKLTARVEKGRRSKAQGPGTAASSSSSNPSLSTTHSPLFTVKTPTATVTDLGTEFGVDVNEEGNTISHVFLGAIKVQTLSHDGKTVGAEQVLHASESARVERGKDHDADQLVVMVDPSIKPAGFVRELPKRTMKVLDLVDVVAGGDGFSGRRDRGIDPTTGRTSDVQPDEVDVRGDYQYHPVEGVPLVDGVFIPDGSQGPVKIDSAGHTFSDCPKTDNGSWAYVWAGGKLPQAIGPWMSATLAGVDYSSAGHSVLVMHANKGITFDLDAVRRGNPDCEVLRFRAVAGNTETESQNGANVSADIWVLVDGQVRFKRREFNGYCGAAPINIPIQANDRFLTLAVTDANNSYMCDQVIFGDAKLELVRTKLTESDAK